MRLPTTGRHDQRRRRVAPPPGIDGDFYWLPGSTGCSRTASRQLPRRPDGPSRGLDPGTVLGHEEPGSDRSVGCGAHVEQIGTRERQGSSTVRCSEAVARSGETSRRAATGSRGLSMRERSRITDRRQDRSERSSRVSLASSCQSVRLLLLSSAANTKAVRSSTRFTSGKPRGVIASFRSPPLPPPARCGAFPPRRSPPLGCRDSAAS